MEVSDQLHNPAALLLGKNMGTHFIGCWLGPRAGLGSFEEEKNVSTLQGFEHRTVQPVASQYTGHDTKIISIFIGPWLYILTPLS